jgi:uncharacterized protein (TIRG00374 family)
LPPPAPSRWRHWILLGKIAGFAVILVLLLRMIDLGELRRLLPRISLFFFACATVVALLDMMVMGLKWNVLLRAFQVRVAWHKPVLAYFTGRFITLFTPSTVGIDAYKSYFLKREGCPLVPVISSIFVERFVGMLSSFAIIALLMPFTVEPLHLEPRAAWMAGGWAVLAALWAGLALSLSQVHRFGGERFVSRLPRVLRKRVRAFLVGISGLRENRSHVLYYFAISTVEKIFYGAVVYCCTRAVGFDLDFFPLISLTPVVALLERLPISFSSIGIREGLFVALLNLFGADATRAVAIALVMRVAEVLLLLLSLLLWFLLESGGTSGQEMKRIQERLLTLGRGGAAAAGGRVDDPPTRC